MVEKVRATNLVYLFSSEEVHVLIEKRASFLLQLLSFTADEEWYIAVMAELEEGLAQLIDQAILENELPLTDKRNQNGTLFL